MKQQYRNADRLSAFKLQIYDRKDNWKQKKKGFWFIGLELYIWLKSFILHFQIKKKLF